MGQDPDKGAHIQKNRNKEGRYAPLGGRDGVALVDELAALLENEVAALRLAVLFGAESSDEEAVGVGDEGVGELFL